MKRVPLLLLAVLVAAVLLAACSGGSPAQVSAPAKPNVLFVMTDDQPATTLNSMPNLQERLVGRGRTFENHIYTYPLCCPSRATMLTGKYAHNTGVVQNDPPYGSWEKFRPQSGSTVATWMDDAGYDTAYMGKYMNYYDGDRVPPGYDRFFGRLDGQNAFLNENGGRVPFAGFDDAVVSEKALAYLDTHADDARPFFLTVGFHSPHDPAEHEDRYAHLFPDAQVPRKPNFAEADLSDKPSWIANNAPLSAEKKAEADALYRKKLRSLRTVDAFIGDALDRLARAGKLQNTYVVYATDNGVHMGHHGLPNIDGKNTPYDTDVNVPLVVRGPGIPAGVASDRVIGNHDIAPTIADMGGARSPDADGRSFLPLAEGRDVAWRQAILSERITPPGEGDPARAWKAVRTRERLYVEYGGGEKELYFMVEDPYQLRSRHADPAAADVRAKMADRLDRMRGCADAACVAAEDEPAP